MNDMETYKRNNTQIIIDTIFKNTNELHTYNPTKKTFRINEIESC